MRGRGLGICLRTCSSEGCISRIWLRLGPRRPQWAQRGYRDMQFLPWGLEWQLLKGLLDALDMMAICLLVQVK